MDIKWFSADYLPWLILFFPLLSFAIIVLFTARDRRTSQYVALLGIGLSWLLSMIEFVNTVWVKDDLGEKVYGSQITWLEVGARTLKMGVLVDPLTAYMLLMVPLACLLIFIYSMGYMHHDPHNSRFFAYISLFAGAMLTLVVADNLLMLFIGWEVMGLCSYLLIGFWFHKKSAYQAGVKAFMTTRVGDVLMLVGIGYLFALTGTLNFREIMYNDHGHMLNELVKTDAAIFGGSAAALIGVLLVMGTVGKSSQFPLQVWLPDAMEGPTPVSAMIHAATMVSAGVYMVIRMFPLLSAGADFHQGEFSSPMVLMGVLGAITALGAAILGMGQNDIKRILAYSTISQLGFMVAALGIGAWVAAAFHLINHAFFKALLFMSSGVVIHSMEHGEHHAHEPSSEHEEEQALPDGLVMDYVAPPNNIQRMGGLMHRIPVTAIAMAIGGLSLAGFPFLTAGFWSKDEILKDAWHGTTEAYELSMFVFICLVAAAVLTAFYTTRMWFMTFWGQPRTAAAEHAGAGMLRNRWVNFWNRTRWGQAQPLESEHTDREAATVAMQMEIPLIILAFFAIFAGFIFPVLPDFLSKTLAHEPTELGMNWGVVVLSLIIVAVGMGFGFWVYGMRPVRAGETDPLERALGPGLWRALQLRFGMDLFYRRYIVAPFQWVADRVGPKVDQEVIDETLHSIADGFVWLGEFFKRFNTVVIDGVGDGIPRGIYDGARWFRQIQSGRIQQYLLIVALALLAIGTLFLLQVM